MDFADLSPIFFFSYTRLEDEHKLRRERVVFFVPPRQGCQVLETALSQVKKKSSPEPMLKLETVQFLLTDFIV